MKFETAYAATYVTLGRYCTHGYNSHVLVSAAGRGNGSVNEGSAPAYYVLREVPQTQLRVVAHRSDAVGDTLRSAVLQTAHMMQFVVHNRLSVSSKEGF